jgi:hypothetical protein
MYGMFEAATAFNQPLGKWLTILNTANTNTNTTGTGTGTFTNPTTGASSFTDMSYMFDSSNCPRENMQEQRSCFYV